MARNKKKSVLGRVKDYISGLFGYWFPIGGSSRQGYYGGGGSADVYGQQPSPGPFDLLNAYEETVYSCVSLISNQIGEIPVRLCVTTAAGQLQPKTTTKALSASSLQWINKNNPHLVRKASVVEEVTDHPLLDLVDRPNKYHTFRQLLTWTETYLELVGSAFWFIARDFSGHARELYLLPSQNITIETDDDGNIKSYLNTIGEESQHLHPNDVIHFRFLNTFDPYTSFGFSPLRSVWQRTMVGRQELSSIQAILTNMAFPSALVYPPEGEVFTDAQAERISKQISERFRLGNQGGVWVVQDGLQYTPTNVPPRDAAAFSIYDQIVSAVCRAFHVPRPLLDLQDSSYAAAVTARRGFQEFCISPRAGLILDTLNLHLANEYDRVFFCTDNLVEADETIEVQRRAALAQEVTALFGANLIHQNEGREKLGYAPVQDGDRYSYQIAPGVAPGMPTPSFGLPKKSKAAGVQIDQETLANFRKP